MSADPTRTLVLTVPDWPAVAAAVEHELSPGTPVAVLHAGRVIAANAPARAAGIAIGNNKRAAGYRCPEARVLPWDEDVDNRHFSAGVGALEDLVARFTLLSPGTLAIPLDALRHATPMRPPPSKPSSPPSCRRPAGSSSPASPTLSSPPASPPPRRAGSNRGDRRVPRRPADHRPRVSGRGLGGAHRRLHPPWARTLGALADSTRSTYSPGSARRDGARTTSPRDGTKHRARPHPDRGPVRRERTGDPDDPRRHTRLPRPTARRRPARPRPRRRTRVHAGDDRPPRRRWTGPRAGPGGSRT